jgi:hypothetical protein
MAVTITTADLNEIKSALGFPLVSTLEITDDSIKTYIVSRVLRTYFTYFPLLLESNYGVDGEFDLDYPNATVYKLHRHFFNYKQIDYGTISPFLLQTLVMNKGWSGFEIGSKEINENINRMSVAETMVDWTKAVKIFDYPNERKVKGHTNTSGDLTLHWSQNSEDFDDIAYNRKEDAITLGKGYLLQDSARLRSQAKIQLKVDIDPTTLKSDGDMFVESVLRRWKTRAFAVISRSNN